MNCFAREHSKTYPYWLSLLVFERAYEETAKPGNTVDASKLVVFMDSTRNVATPLSLSRAQQDTLSILRGSLRPPEPNS